MSANKETAIEAKTSGFLALANSDIGAMMAEELDGLDAGFEKIKIPSGGGLTYEIPGDDDEPESTKEFSAVILYQHALNAYYKAAYTGGSNPPDCASFDGITGVGEPGGNCQSCPLNQYGSSANGGKACQNRRRLFVLREGELFPLMLSLPTGSLPEFTRYLKRLISKSRKSNSVVTRFSLKKATNKGGLVYSQGQFSIDRVLTPEEHSLISKLSGQVKAFSARVGYDDATPVEDSMIDTETGEVVAPLDGSANV
jgi:hypothetical protein